jgi:two-component system OmpR family response regulator
LIVEDVQRGPLAVFACSPPQAGDGVNRSVTAAALSVIVVDDEPDIPEVVSATLRMHGHTVAIATSGVRALTLARSTPYELVISDCMMPGMHGGQLFSALSQEFRHPFWFILMSGLSEREVRRLCPDCHAFLQKPFQLETLIGAVETGRKALRG